MGVMGKRDARESSPVLSSEPQHVAGDKGSCLEDAQPSSLAEALHPW